MKVSSVKKELKKYVDLEKKDFLPKFFKTGPGEYGERDRFLGVNVPNQRKVAKAFWQLPRSEVQILLDSKFHEERLTGLLILTHQYQKGDEKEQQAVAKFYIKNFAAINNWDLVDTTAPKILGPHFISRSKKPLYTWAKSKNLWKRRIAILTTFHFISKDQFDDSLALAEISVNDEHDLIHKAVGWMLREIGKRDLAREEEFLQKHYKSMPRTMLRYAIEKFPEKKRKAYLQGEVASKD